MLPGCLNYQSLEDTVRFGQVHIKDVDPKLQATHFQQYISNHKFLENDKAWHLKGGFVQDFYKTFNPNDFNLENYNIRHLDKIFHWSMQAAHEAISEVRSLKQNDLDRGGIVLGNLLMPTDSFLSYSEHEIVSRLFPEKISTLNPIDPINRYSGGAVARLTANVLNMKGDAYSLDAACASGLYAIKEACQRLQNHQNDFMLAGSTNATNLLFINVLFSELGALSKEGMSRPFNKLADGLIPAEGTSYVALKRLEDAVDASDRIFGVIRGVGLSNSGRETSFLAPSRSGEQSAIKQAYDLSGVEPDDVRYVECHATGTQLGDLTEVEALGHFFDNRNEIVLSSFKANIGHLLPGAGTAGLLKLISCMENEYFPVTPNSHPTIPSVADYNFCIPNRNKVWTLPKIAAIDAFGFGGNNAHLILEKYIPSKKYHKNTKPCSNIVSVIDFELQTSNYSHEIQQNMLGLDDSHSRDLKTVELNMLEQYVPPNDLKVMNSQQLFVQSAMEQLKERVNLQGSKKIGVFVGMNIDPEMCRYDTRIRLRDVLNKHNVQLSDKECNDLKNKISQPLTHEAIVGFMTQLIANRVSYTLNLHGPSYVINAEEQSFSIALRSALNCLNNSEIDMAIVGCVELGTDKIHRSSLLNDEEQIDAVGLFVVTKQDKAVNEKFKLKLLDENLEQVNDIQLESHSANEILSLISKFNKLANLTHKQDTVVSTGSRFNPTSAIELLDINCDIKIKTPIIKRYAANSANELIEMLEADLESNHGAYRCAITCLQNQLSYHMKLAVEAIKKDPERIFFSRGVSYCNQSVDGKLAFVFPGSGAAYPGVAESVSRIYPELLASCSTSNKIYKEVPSWAFNSGQEPGVDYLDDTIITQAVNQLHAAYLQEILCLQPDAVLGISIGEINALYAFGVWNNVDVMIEKSHELQLYTKYLSGTHNTVKEHWALSSDDKVDWSNYYLRNINVEKSLVDISGYKHIYPTIIYSDNEFMLSGNTVELKNYLSSLDNKVDVHHVKQELAIHCNAAEPFSPSFHKLYSQEVAPNEKIAFYSNYFSKSYKQDQSSICEALTGQAINTIDFRKTILRSYDDGIRIFVELGPRDHLKRAINKTLAKNEHYVISLDRENFNNTLGLYQTAADLWVLGKEINYSKLKIDYTHGDESRGEIKSRKIKINTKFPELKPFNLIRAKTDNHQIFSEVHNALYSEYKQYTKSQEMVFKEHNRVLNKALKLVLDAISKDGKDSHD